MNFSYKSIGFVSSLLLHGGLLIVLLWQQPFQTTKVFAALPVNMEMFSRVQHTPSPIVPEKSEEVVKAIKIPQQVVEVVKAKKVELKKVIAVKMPAKVEYLVATLDLDNLVSERPVVTESDNASVLNSAERDRIRGVYVQQIVAIIASHKYYPRRARRRHLEGRVEVGFDVLADGTINNVRLTNSSDSGVLDSAALDVLRRVGRFDPLPEELGLSLWAFVMPLDYRLL